MQQIKADIQGEGVFFDTSGWRAATFSVEPIGNPALDASSVVYEVKFSHDGVNYLSYTPARTMTQTVWQTNKIDVIAPWYGVFVSTAHGSFARPYVRAERHDLPAIVV